MGKSTDITDKRHFKMYKSKKRWLIAGISVFFGGVMLMAPQMVSASTGETAPASQATEVTAPTITAPATTTEDAEQSDPSAGASANSTTQAPTATQTTRTTASDSTGTASASDDSATQNSGVTSDPVDSSTSENKDVTAQPTAPVAETAVTKETSTGAKTAETTAAEPAVKMQSKVAAASVGVNGDTATEFSVKDPTYPDDVDHYSEESDYYTFFAGNLIDRSDTDTTDGWSDATDTITGSVILSVDRATASTLVVNYVPGTPTGGELTSSTVVASLSAGEQYTSGKYTVYDDGDSVTITVDGSQTNDAAGREHYSAMVITSNVFGHLGGQRTTDTEATYYIAGDTIFMPKIRTQVTSYINANTGEELKDEHVQKGLDGQSYTTPTDVSIPGYQLDSADTDNMTGYLSPFEDGVPLTQYVHTTVNGKDVIEQIVYTVKNASDPSAANYGYADWVATLADGTDEGSGTLAYYDPATTPAGTDTSNDEAQTATSYNLINPFIPQTTNIVYQYIGQPVNLTVNYVDKATDKAIKAPTIISSTATDFYRYGDHYNVEATGTGKDAITGYTYDPTALTEFELSNMTDNVITLYYDANTETVTVKHVDDGAGEEAIGTDTTIADVKFGSTLTLPQNATAVPGYTLVSGQSLSYDVTGDTGAANTITLHYVKTAAVSRTVPYTVTYVNGDDTTPDHTQNALYTRTVNVTYDDTGAVATLTYGDWTTATTIDPVTSPVLANKVADKLTVQFTVPTEQTTDPTGATTTVTYARNAYTVTPNTPAAGQIAPGDSGDPIGTTGLKYPAGVTTADLEQTVAYTVHYVNGDETTPDNTQTATSTRTASFTFDPATGVAGPVSYSNWTTTTVIAPVPTPTVTGKVPDQTSVTFTVPTTSEQLPAATTKTVTYYAAKQLVEPSDPRNQGDPVDPANPASPKYPAGVAEADLHQNATQLIHYIDQKGNQVAPDHLQTIHYEREATVDFTDVTNPTVTYGTWVLGTGETGTFAATTSPSIADMTPDLSAVAAMPVTGPVPVVLDVFYYPTIQTVTPTAPKTTTATLNPRNPASPHYPAGVDQAALNQTVTETIHYNDANGQAVAPDYSATLTLHRSAEVNFATGTVTYEPWSTAAFAAEPSPVVAGQTPDQATVPSYTVTNPVAGLDLVVDYFATKQTVTVATPHDSGTPVTRDPNGPQWPSGVTASDLSQTVTRTIAYETDDGQVVAPSVTQTVTLTRTALVDFTAPTAPVVTYSPWSTAAFTAVTNPLITGYTTATTSVPAAAAMATDPAQQVVVTYQTADLPETGDKVPTTPAPQPAVAAQIPTPTPQPTTAVQQPATKTANDDLPTTGDATDRSLSALGLGLTALLSTIGLLGTQKRRRADR